MSQEELKNKSEHYGKKFIGKTHKWKIMYWTGEGIQQKQHETTLEECTLEEAIQKLKESRLKTYCLFDENGVQRATEIGLHMKRSNKK